MVSCISCLYVLCLHSFYLKFDFDFNQHCENKMSSMGTFFTKIDKLLQSTSSNLCGFFFTKHSWNKTVNFEFWRLTLKAHMTFQISCIGWLFSHDIAEQLSKRHTRSDFAECIPRFSNCGTFFLSFSRCFSGMSNIWGLKGFNPKAPATCAGTLHQHLLTFMQEEP